MGRRSRCSRPAALSHRRRQPTAGGVQPAVLEQERARRARSEAAMRSRQLETALAEFVEAASHLRHVLSPAPRRAVRARLDGYAQAEWSDAALLLSLVDRTFPSPSASGARTPWPMPGGGGEAAGELRGARPLPRKYGRGPRAGEGTRACARRDQGADGRRFRGADRLSAASRAPPRGARPARSLSLGPVGHASSYASLGLWRHLHALTSSL